MNTNKQEEAWEEATFNTHCTNNGVRVVHEQELGEIPYNFHERKLSQIGGKLDFCGEKFHGLLIGTANCAAKGHHAPRFRRDNFHKQPQ